MKKCECGKPATFTVTAAQADGELIDMCHFCKECFPAQELRHIGLILGQFSEEK